MKSLCAFALTLLLVGCGIEPNPTPGSDFPGSALDGDGTDAFDGTDNNERTPSDVWASGPDSIGGSDGMDAADAGDGIDATDGAVADVVDGDAVPTLDVVDDALELDAGGDVTEPSPGHYPPDPTTSGIVLEECGASYVDTVMPWSERPSSNRTCWLSGEAGAAGVSVPCLPWERCDRGLTGCDFDPTATGSFKCFSPCADGLCAAGGECKSFVIDDCDLSVEVPGCVGASNPESWPSYPDAGLQPSEGGLDCWTALAEMPGQNSGSRVTRVGDFVYMLFWQSGTSVADGSLVSSRRLQVLPFVAPSSTDSLVTLVAEEGSDVQWTRLRRSGGRLLVLQRPSSAGDTVPNTILWGTPAEDGSVVLEPSGITIDLPGDRGAPVPGTDHGCLLRRDEEDLRLHCFPVVDAVLTHTETPLGVPKGVIEYLDYYAAKIGGGTPISTRTWTAAASANWFAIASGDACDVASPKRLHYAPFDRAKDAIIGEWSTVELDEFFPSCSSFRSLLIYEDTLLLDGLSTRLSTTGISPWLAVTQPMVGAGTPMDRAMAGDVVLSLALLSLTGEDPPAQLSLNRILW